METEKIALCCSNCHQEVKSEEKVTLDIVNTMTHVDCTPTGFTVKDSGSFEKIKKLPLFISTKNKVNTTSF